MPDEHHKRLSRTEERALSDAVFNSIGDGTIATDEFGRVTRINPAALRILGYKRSEVLGKWYPQTIVALDQNQQQPISLIDRPITKAFLTGASISEKMFYRRKDGQLVPVAVTVSPLILKDRPVGAVEVFRDVSTELEIDRMKSEFISLASHQLRTPLSAIKTYTHMLLEGYMGKTNAQQRQSLRTITAAANRMNELISTLLNITRIESGNIRVAAKPTDLKNLAEVAIEELQHSAAEKEIELVLEQATKLVRVKTDGLLVKEIINNLISNAIKYSPNGSRVIVRLSARRQAAVLSVHDRGFGIPKSAQEQIFTKFFRAGNVVRRETSGTGLGLYLVRGLTESLGGKIWFDSEEGKGSTFYLSLPRS